MAEQKKTFSQTLCYGLIGATAVLVLVYFFQVLFLETY